jgi:hypothetical protein
LHNPLVAPVLAILAVLLSSSPARAQSTSATTIPAATQAPQPAPAAMSTPARAPAFGEQGSVSIAAERLFGLSHASSGSGSGSGITTVSFLGGSGGELVAAPYSIPRIGFDYFPGRGLSLGLGAEFAYVDLGSGTTIVGLNPRLGYVVRVSDGFSLWPRAGVSYVRLSGGSQSAYLLAASLEVQAVVTPFQNFGFMLAPTIDIGLSATGSTVTQLGLQGGLIGWF